MRYVDSISLWPQEEKAGGGSICNKAIMIITDGAPENYVDVYNRSNWPEKAVSRKMPEVDFLASYGVGKEKKNKYY